MTIDDQRNRRAFARNHLVTGQLPGRLVSDQDVTALVIDVSRDGLGVITSRPFPRGDNLWLIIDDHSIKLEVRHCRPEGRDTPTWRCGLRSVAPWDDLEGLFIRSGVARPSALLDY
jgi:hypothetical protein